MFLSGIIVLAVLFLLALALVPILLTSLGLDKWNDIFDQLSEAKKKLVAIKQYFLDKKGFNYRLYLLVLIFAIYGLLDYWDQWSQLKMVNLEGFGLLSSSGDLVLYFTLLAIIVYTLETYRLRDETYKVAEATTKQIDFHLAPFVTVGWDENNPRFPKHLYVKNMGRGVALSIRVERYPKIANTGYQEVEYKFKPITSISAEDRSGVEIPYRDEWRQVGDDRVIPVELANVNLMNPDHNYRLVVDYKDLVGGKYQTVVESNRGYNQNFKVVSYKTPFGSNEAVID